METSKHNSPNIYAHSLPEQPRTDWQTLETHANAVAIVAAKFAADFQCENWAWNAGQLHDIGKADPTFQAYLLRCNGLDDSEYDVAGQGRVNHSSAGAAFALNDFPPVIGHALAYIIAGHHAGLPDWESSETGNASLKIRVVEGRGNVQKIPRAVESARATLRALVPPPYIKPATYHIWVRLLFSCLVDADYLDTEAFMQPDQISFRGGYAGMAKLKQLFDNHMLALTESAEQTDLNSIRKEILSACRSSALKESGLFSLTVPTGGGKTLSAMAFALEHALLHGKTRIIYVIPYTSIIEQTANTLSEIFGAEQVIEHHSNLNPEKETQRMRMASENWDAPIIVTTNVQFFESLFSAKPSRCRKLHNIVNSVVILDEAQMLSPELLSPCVAMLNTLTRDYNTTVLLTTATQPALAELPQPFQSMDESVEIIQDRATLYAKLKRVEYAFPKDIHKAQSWDEIADELQGHENVLCIVNTRRDCHDLFQLMPEGTIHLSALMCGEHRSRVIAEIKRRLKDNNPTRVISTQLVEAGVDIDFPVVYRALCGLDSIAQAAGRCNREGKLEKGMVHVFVPPRDAPKGLLRKGKDTTCEILCDNPDLHLPETFHRYFQQFYSKVNDMGSLVHQRLEKGIPEIFFRTAASEFKLIDDRARRSVIVRYGDSPKWVEKLNRFGPSREIMRRLQRYTVNLHTHMIDNMLTDGRLSVANQNLAPDILVQGIIRYDSVIGLDIYRANLPVEDLII